MQSACQTLKIFLYLFYRLICILNMKHPLHFATQCSILHCILLHSTRMYSKLYVTCIILRHFYRIGLDSTLLYTIGVFITVIDIENQSQ